MEQKEIKNRTMVRGGSAGEEGLFGIFCGVVYGFTSPLVGQPFDTIKTKMQAQQEYMRMGMVQTFVDIWKREGIPGLYRGLVPPLMGSVIFRSLQFGAYSFAYKSLDGTVATSEIPFSGGLQWRVILSGLVSSTARCTIETPLELIKVRRQVGQSWTIRELYKGYTITWIRTSGLMCSFFVMVDSGERHIPHVFAQPVIGPFLKGGVCATIAWWIVWPAEILKSQIQGNTPGPKTMLKRLVWVIKNDGIRSIFRGILPGTIRSMIANGASMLAFTLCQDIREGYERQKRL